MWRHYYPRIREGEEIMSETVRISITLRKEQKEALDVLVNQTGKSLSQVVRDGLAGIIGSDWPDDPQVGGDRRYSWLKPGSTVTVSPFLFSQHLSKGASIHPPKVHQHTGYRRVLVRDVFKDELTGEPQVDVIVSPGLVDHVPASACRPIDG
jgi:hypothetical protein